MGDGFKRLYTDLDIKCWQGDHLGSFLGAALPSLLLFVIGLPLILFYLAYKN